MRITIQKVGSPGELTVEIWADLDTNPQKLFTVTVE